MFKKKINAYLTCPQKNCEKYKAVKFPNITEYY